MIILSNNNHNNNKYNTYNKQNTYKGRKQTILIYYIQTMKRLLYLICSVNITFIKYKGVYVFNS